MKKNILIVLLIMALQSPAQNVITISAGGNFYMDANALVSFDKLVLNPLTSINIVDNRIQKAAALVHSTRGTAINQSFQFLNTLPGYNGTIIMYYNDGDLNGLVESYLTLNIHNGTGWAAFPAASHDSVNNFVTTSGLSSVSLNELTLASLTGALPVVYSLLNIACRNGGIVVVWKTAQEQNSQRYDIERSSDGVNWQSAGSVNAAGTSTTERSYSFTDNNPLAFYRIVQVDIDGTKKISTILRSSCVVKDVFSVYPNPVQDQLNVSFKINRAGNSLIILYDAGGKLVRQWQKNLLQGNNYFQLSLAGLPVGSYSLFVASGEDTYSANVIHN
jgi:hypothetical protein